MLTHFSISQQGQRHIEKNIPCQDYSASNRLQLETIGCDVIIAAVADGVGSCEFSQYGSKTAVENFLNCVEYNLKNKVDSLTDENVLKLIKYAFNYALAQVEKEAEDRELPFLEFDSTLTGVIYDGHHLWYGHIGDDGAVVLYSDGTYEMITKRHKGEEAHSVFPLREQDLWQFGKSEKEVASCVLMTDGVLDHCVDTEKMNSRVYFPFLEPALTTPIETDEESENQRLDWYEYLAGNGNYDESFRKSVTDDISFVVVQNPDLVKNIPTIDFDFDKWDEDTKKRKKELDEALYADYRAYKAGTYKSPVEPAKGYTHSKASTDITSHRESSGSDTIGANGTQNQDGKNPVPCNGEFEGYEDQDGYDDASVIDDVCSEVAETLIDVIKSAHSVGRYVRNQFKPKKSAPRSSTKASPNEYGQKRPKVTPRASETRSTDTPEDADEANNKNSD